MATGYTFCVEEGASFEEFVWGCTRAMGVLITMRDEPLDAKIPKKLEPQDYHFSERAKALKLITELVEMPLKEAEVRAEMEHKTLLQCREDCNTKTEEIQSRYEAMISRVRAWIPPTEEHEGLKRFMLEQLESCLRDSCSREEAPKRRTAKEWKAATLEEAQRNLQYHEREWQEEQERTKQRNEWLAALRASVPQPRKLSR